jgi:hypothetical protein
VTGSTNTCAADESTWLLIKQKQNHWITDKLETTWSLNREPAPYRPHRERSLISSTSLHLHRLLKVSV